MPRPARMSMLRAIAAPRDPERFFRLASRAGDPFCIRLPGAGDVVLTGSAAGARELFGASPSLFEPMVPNPVEPLLGPGSLILLSADRHARERRLMSTPLCGARMRALGPVVRDAAAHALEAQAGGARISAQTLAQDVTLEVIVRAAFGVREPQRQAALRAATVRMLDAYTPHLMFVPSLRRGWAGAGWRRFVRARAAFDELLVAEIARKRRDGLGDDMLSLLLAMRYDDGTAMSEAALLDELRTLLVAGHETTATGLQWALHYVHADESVRRRLAGELEAVDTRGDPQEIASLPYLSAVCQEALRIHPVVPLVLRRLRAPMRWRDLSLEAGTNVGVAVTLLHHDPEHYPDPDRFEPQRFVGTKLPPHVYAPFGGGHRRCLGAGFASYELKISLAMIMGAGRLEPVPGKQPRPVLRNITMGPNVDLQFTRRASIAV